MRNNKSFQILKTERLVLRELRNSDQKEILELRSDEEVNKYLDRPTAKTIEDAEIFVNDIQAGMTGNQWIYWAITLKDEDKLVGTICYWNISKNQDEAEIGFELLPEYQGKGIMQETLSSIINFGLEIMGFKSIIAIINPYNHKSIHLLEKIGFSLSSTSEEEKINMLTYVLNEKSIS